MFRSLKPFICSIFCLFATCALSEDVCRQYENCDLCLGDPKCGWCNDYNLCIPGNKTGPDEGSCDWYYYSCPSNDKTTTTTISPSNEYNISWMTFGGDSQRSGFVNFTKKISSKTSYSQDLNHAAGLDFQVSSVSAYNNTLYFYEYSYKFAETHIIAYSLPTMANLWTNKITYAFYRPYYSSGPTIIQEFDNTLIVSLVGGDIDGNRSTQNPVVFDNNGFQVNNSYNMIDTWNYFGVDQVWSTIPPVVSGVFDFADYNHNSREIAISFVGTGDSFGYYIGYNFGITSVINGSGITKFEKQNFQIGGADEGYYNPDYDLYSFQPSYYNGTTFWHWNNTLLFGSSLSNDTATGDIVGLIDDKISYNGNNLNSTIVISKKNNLLFVCGYYCVAYKIVGGGGVGVYLLETWFVYLYGGSNQGVTPSVDDEHDLVFFYDDGKIYGYDQLIGELIYTYGDDNRHLSNACTLGYIGCLSKQAIITPYNVIWADGNDVVIFDKITQDQVITIEDVCTNNADLDIGTTIAWYNDYLLISCPNQVVIYQF